MINPGAASDIGAANTGQPELGTIDQLRVQAPAVPIQASSGSSAPNKPVSRGVMYRIACGRFALCATAIMGLAIYKDLAAMGVIVCAALALALAGKVRASLP